MKTVEDSERLAEEMVSIGKAAGRKVTALITDMDIPLGASVGNSLEVIEAIKTLKGEGEKNLTEVCLSLAAQMLCMVTGRDDMVCRKMAKKSIEDGSALNKLREMITAQGGNADVIDNSGAFKQPKFYVDIISERDGYISRTDAERVGIASVILGAGREKKGDPIDPSAGIILKKKTGDSVSKGDVLATFYTDDETRIDVAKREFLDALIFGNEKPSKQKLIYKIIK